MAALRPLAPADLALVRALQTELGDGAAITPARWHALAATQAHLALALDVAHGPANATEPFALYHPDLPLSRWAVGTRFIAPWGVGRVGGSTCWGCATAPCISC